MLHKFLVLLTGLAGLVLAVRKDCPPDACFTVRCGTYEELCKKQGKDFRPNAGYCGCCHLCMPYIPEGGKCGKDVVYQDEVQSCEPGTVCSKKSQQCTKASTKS